MGTHTVRGRDLFVRHRGLSTAACSLSDRGCERTSLPYLRINLGRLRECENGLLQTLMSRIIMPLFRCRVRVALETSLVVLVASGGAQLGAQTSGAATAGARVRIVLADSVRQAPLITGRLVLVGTLTRSTPDSLAVRIMDDTVRLARPAVRRLDVSHGASRGRSAAEQAVLAAVVFAAAEYASSNKDNRDRGRRVVTVGALGAALGGLLGALRPYEHWSRLNK